MRRRRAVTVPSLTKLQGTTGSEGWGVVDPEMFRDAEILFRTQLLMFMWTCVLLILWAIIYSLLTYLRMI